MLGGRDHSPAVVFSEHCRSYPDLLIGLLYPIYHNGSASRLEVEKKSFYRNSSIIRHLSFDMHFIAHLTAVTVNSVAYAVYEFIFLTFNRHSRKVFKIFGNLNRLGRLVFRYIGKEIVAVRQRVFSWLPRFEIYRGEQYLGCINKEFTFFKPRFNIEYNGWQVGGDWLEWDYTITDGAGRRIATVSKELWQWTDTYVIDVWNAEDALCALMLVLAIDAEKCSRDN